MQGRRPITFRSYRAIDKPITTCKSAQCLVRIHPGDRIATVQFSRLFISIILLFELQCFRGARALVPVSSTMTLCDC
jgi:hypothetical protein